MSAPRVLVVTPYGVGGGVTEAFFTSLEILCRAGGTPLAAIDAGAAFRGRLAAVETHEVPRLGAGGSLNAFLAGRRLRRLARRLRPDFILAHNGRYIDALAGLGAPLTGVVHGGKLKRFLRADRLITVNAEQRDGLIALGFPAGRVRLIPNALPVDTLPPFAPRPFAPRPPATPLRIGTLRLLLREKGVDVLIEAAGLLAARGLAVDLHIGGTGAEDAALRAQAARLGLAGRVTFHGWVGDQAGFLSALDLYVMPSRHETFGIGILEAQAAGLPVIASACEGPRAVIRDGETGLLVPPGDAAALADAVARLSADPALAGDLARRGHADCAARHLLPAIAGAYADVVLGHG
ncbi:glycosyltransferase family 4 protein [Zavarzinia compransoris]|uniref:Glycosyltransferase subfamily 4-like N-terminal domain-containing protein n=1 Tax=Zavarzinia compransoris TaxID=1264899 RepID=A0A317E148_9PROT|nr:glycosyltransferase family 4 protein [Zavarzinia compransoris]PWR20807.1 hypothetical protein DKG75_12505 [Zavarzinia compransoris]TDP44358.1 glycosyltransferase involved in cell wall biosynthesis [Zavarzinia compransoris]